jgi:hypothetical protein
VTTIKRRNRYKFITPSIIDNKANVPENFPAPCFGKISKMALKPLLFVGTRTWTEKSSIVFRILLIDLFLF